MATLSELGQRGITVYFCDEKHTSCAIMVQYSFYARVCNGIDAVDKHRARLKMALPENGSVRLMVVTEKQYEAIEILVGDLHEDDTPFVCEQLSIF